LRHGDGAALSQRLGWSTRRFVERIGGDRARPAATVGRALGCDRYLELMRVDKKAEAGEIKFVVIDRRASAVMRPRRDEVVRRSRVHASARRSR
jgi:3-dehydroquinate synthase